MLYLAIQMALSAAFGSILAINNLQGKPLSSIVFYKTANLLADFYIDERINVSGEAYDPNSDLKNLNSRLLKVSSTIIEMISELALYFFLFLLFRNYSQGKIFQLENSKILMISAVIYMLNSAVVSQICTNLNLLAATINLPKGERVFTISFRSAELASFAKGILLVVISWIMKEAHHIKEEQDLVV